MKKAFLFLFFAVSTLYGAVGCSSDDDRDVSEEPVVPPVEITDSTDVTNTPDTAAIVLGDTAKWAMRELIGRWKMVMDWEYETGKVYNDYIQISEAGTFSRIRGNEIDVYTLQLENDWAYYDVHWGEQNSPHLRGHLYVRIPGRIPLYPWEDQLVVDIALNGVFLYKDLKERNVGLIISDEFIHIVDPTKGYMRVVE